MSRNTIFVLMYHGHKLADLIYKARLSSLSKTFRRCVAQGMRCQKNVLACLNKGGRIIYYIQTYITVQYSTYNNHWVLKG
jgi:Tfp pilus assembly ATPase PilU